MSGGHLVQSLLIARTTRADCLGPFPLGFEHLQGLRLHSLSGYIFQCWTTFMVEKHFLVYPAGIFFFGTWNVGLLLHPSKTSRIISSLYIFQVSVGNLKTTLNSPESSSVKLAQMLFSELLCCVPRLYAMSHSHLDDAPLDLQRSFCRPRLPFFWTGFLYIVMNFNFFCNYGSYIPSFNCEQCTSNVV